MQKFTNTKPERQLNAAINENSPAELKQWQRQPPRWILFLERLALWMERPFTKLIGTPQLNPFYHTGTIASYLALVVGLTGFYIFLFYKYGFEESYLAVLQMDNQIIARTIRAMHRYASGALVITTLLHAYRTLFMERFRGQRWLAWVTGVVLTAIIWLAGVTGYWLIWDTRAQLINDGFVRFLHRFTPWADDFVLWITNAEISGNSWPVMLLILTIHVLLFVIIVYFFYLHLRRMSRAKWLPEMHWVVGATAVLLLVSIFLPLSNLPIASSLRLPESITLDPLFLFYLPTEGGAVAPWVWGGLLLITAVSLILPWITRDHSVAEEVDGAAAPAYLPLVNIIDNRCTGCTLCAEDCPYDAIEMVEREDGKLHKYIAIANPSMCTSCGICVGACDDFAITLGDSPPELLWDAAAMRLTMAQAKSPDQPVKLLFTCDRHAALGARPFLAEHDGSVRVGETAVEIIPVPCVGALPPNMMIQALEAGASEIQVIGCPPEDCRNREGNLWTEKRLMRQRVPRLKRDYANAPITAYWVAPDKFDAAFHAPSLVAKSPGKEPDYMGRRKMFPDISLRSLAILFVMMVVVLIAQAFLTDVPFTSRAATDISVLKVVVDNPAAPFYPAGGFVLPQRPLNLRLELDGDLLAEEIYEPAAFFSESVRPFIEEIQISPGSHHVRLAFVDEQLKPTIILYEADAVLAAGDILRIVLNPLSKTFCRGFICLR
ncbi:MAG: hydrogenase iron-sulfur subunit [Chloroflexi bacterium]|nr:hydrogenase iron-sulfur subunit [Chloroflexota bacterium]